MHHGFFDCVFFLESPKRRECLLKIEHPKKGGFFAAKCAFFAAKCAFFAAKYGFSAAKCVFLTEKCDYFAAKCAFPWPQGAIALAGVGVYPPAKMARMDPLVAVQQLAWARPHGGAHPVQHKFVVLKAIGFGFACIFFK